MQKPLRIAVTCGEPAGIGAEVAWKALGGQPWPGVEFYLVGPSEVWRRSFVVAGKPSAINASILEPPDQHPFDWEWGLINPHSAGAALLSVKTAAKMALAGEVDAIVTAPLTKEGLSLAFCEAPGHTELLGEMCGGEPRMLFSSDTMKVILVTTHLPLSKVPAAITGQAVLSTIFAAHQGMILDFGMDSPRIGVASLNPHAGEGGRLGFEDLNEVAPAVREARRLGMNATGPVPADALFASLNDNAYDIVVAMYHDQGLGPFKFAHFHDGVNVTLGLPIVRTSPDHGTGFDLAGKGTARGGSMSAAIKTGCEIVLRRRGFSP